MQELDKLKLPTETNNKITTRAEARARGLKQYFTGRPCKHGHVAPRQVVNSTCTACSNERRNKRYYDNHDAEKAYKRDHYVKNREYYAIQAAKRYAENLEARRQANRLYAAKNRESSRERALRWQRENRARYNANMASRRARVRSAQPEWADKQEIAKIYSQAKLAEAVTGLKYHVDHIIPLQGKNVCGLHVPWNLQILEATDNLVKGNRINIGNRNKQE